MCDARCCIASALRTLVCALLLCAWTSHPSLAMRVDPERIAARLRIEHEIEMDRLLSRNRRQLATPKEISISITAPLFSSRLFEYGADAGDQEVPRSLDVGKKVTLANPIHFYGQKFFEIYILSNGGIGFESSSRSYKANVLPNSVRLIAPFWNRNDLRNGGHIYYREITSGRALERGQSEIRYQYDVSEKVKSCLLITWDKMQPLGAAPLPDDNTNTFQAALFITENGTYANFIYKNIGWTQGAEAGFSKGDGSRHYALPTSGTGNIMYLEEYGNTGIPGEWMFVLADERVERCKAGIKGDTCDEECSQTEWGADCASCCHCAAGNCNAVNGECPDGACAECWMGPPACQLKKEQCRVSSSAQCAHNAISFTDYDRCGEPIQRCQCLTGYQGDGHTKCTDVDECEQPGTCHEHALCTNTPGRFFCQCKEGFSGDGVSECVTSFLYPFDGAQTLPRQKNAKVSWQLKYPIVVFGEPRHQLTISTQGLVVLEDVTQVKSGDRLEVMGVHGIAPFYAPIDITKGGEVLVDESTESDVLTRATQTVKENFNDESFVATSVVTITFVNVTTGSSKSGNTFQSLLIGGTNKRADNFTFVQMLYKDLPWSDGAEAGIMSLDEANSILLPGSGTEGIEQLSQLSNIRTPGHWLYRIDSETVLPCTQPNLQPPYCDADSPTRVGQRLFPTPSALPTPPSTRKPSTTSEAVVSSRTVTVSPNLLASTVARQSQSPPIPTTTTTTAASSALPPDVVEIPGPRIIQPVIIEPVHARQGQDNRLPLLPTSPRSAVPQFTPPLPSTTPHTATSRLRPAFHATPSTPHVPLVSIDSHDIEDIPPDAFDVTFPPFITVVPQLFIPKNATTVGPTDGEVALVGTPSIEEVDLGTVELLPSNDKAKEKNPTTVEGVVVMMKGTTPSSVVKVKPTEVDFNVDPEVVVVRPTQLSIAKPVIHGIPTTSPLPHEEVVDANEPVEETPNKPLFVFTTPSQNRAMPTKPKLVTAKAPTTASPNGPFDSTKHETKAETSTSTSNLAVIIPIAIVTVWLLLLFIIGILHCCRKKRAERHFRDLYFPSHHIQPVTAGAYAVRKTSKHFDGSYEDHLEKAARLSSELSSYNQSGRISLYGSYWNLGNSAGTSSSTVPSDSRQSPFAYNAQQRFAYNGRC